MPVPELQSLPAASVKHFAWLKNPALQKIIGALEASKSGGNMFVGGCVRDSLLGHPPQLKGVAEPTDIDIATVLSPDQTIRALETANLKTVPSGYDHGTITAVAEALTTEITSLRADIDTDGRHATVRYTDDWDQDWRRRDFTINAIYLSPDGRLFDPAGGVCDLRARKVAFIGDAHTRIREDYLRILRFYRFSARFANAMNAAGTQACEQLSDGLQQISAERINHEFMRLLAGPRLPFILKALQEAEILAAVFPEKANISLAQSVFELTQHHGQGSPELILAALWSEPTKVAVKLKFSRAQKNRAQAAHLAGCWLREQPSEARAKELLYRQGDKTYTDGLILAWAQSLAGARGEDANIDWRKLLDLPKRWVAPANPFSGSQFKKLGVKQGPDMGRLLEMSEHLWIEADYPPDPTSLDEIRQKAVKSLL